MTVSSDSTKSFKHILLLGFTEIPIDEEDSSEAYEEETNNISGDNDGLYAPTKHSDAILAQPGLLAGMYNVFRQTGTSLVASDWDVTCAVRL